MASNVHLHEHEDQSWQTQPQPFSNVSYEEPLAAAPGFIDSWNGLDSFSATDLGTSDFPYPSPLTSSPASSWPANGPPAAQTTSSPSAASFLPILSDSGFAPQAGTASAMPKPPWQVVGVQKLDSSNQRHSQAAMAGCTRSMTTATSTPPSSTPMSPQTAVKRPQQTNKPSSSPRMQTLHNGQSNAQPCLRCGYQDHRLYSRSQTPFENISSAPAIAATPAPLSPTNPNLGFDLSQYGIDINLLPDPLVAQVNKHGAEVLSVDQGHRRNSSHDSCCAHICPTTRLQPHQQVTQHVPQQATRREFNGGQGAETVLLVLMKNSNQAS